jgi:hypothetical protein
VHNNEKNTLNNDEFFGSSMFFATQEKQTQDDDEPKGLSSFCEILKNKHKIMTSFFACRCLLQPKKKNHKITMRQKVHCCLL